ncbi:MAG: DUF4364 family protein [Dorea sp.]|nr:DUF4364 family protein [Dorea sp.]
MTTAFKLYKLIVLYMLGCIDFPLTNSQISEFVLEQGYTNYFKLHQVIGELIDDRLIRKESTHNRTLYYLTEEGEKTVRLFRNDISPDIRKDIQTYLKNNEYKLRDEISVRADYYLNSADEYNVHCQIMEQGLPLIDLTVTVPTKSEASTIANNWSAKNQEIYALVMKTLLK